MLLGKPRRVSLQHSDRLRPQVLARGQSSSLRRVERRLSVPGLPSEEQAEGSTRLRQQMRQRPVPHLAQEAHSDQGRHSDSPLPRVSLPGLDNRPCRRYRHRRRRPRRDSADGRAPHRQQGKYAGKRSGITCLLRWQNSMLPRDRHLKRTNLSWTRYRSFRRRWSAGDGLGCIHYDSDRYGEGSVQFQGLALLPVVSIFYTLAYARRTIQCRLLFPSPIPLPLQRPVSVQTAASFGACSCKGRVLVNAPGEMRRLGLLVVLAPGAIDTQMRSRSSVPASNIRLGAVNAYFSYPCL